MPVPSPGDLPDPGVKPGFPAFQADSLLFELQERPSELPGELVKIQIAGPTLEILNSEGPQKLPVSYRFEGDTSTVHPGNLPNSEIETLSLMCLLHWQVDSLPLVPFGKPL